MTQPSCRLCGIPTNDLQIESLEYYQLSSVGLELRTLNLKVHSECYQLRYGVYQITVRSHYYKLEIKYGGNFIIIS